MKTTNTLLALAVSAFLVACGSSSSQSSTPPTGKTTGETTGKTTGETTDKATEKTTAGTETGLQITANRTTGSSASISTYAPTADLNQFVINGQTIDLTPSGFSHGGFLLLGTDNGVNDDNTQRYVSGNKYSQVRFGLLTQKGSNKVTGFSQGNVTKDMPTEGVLSYAGDYVGYDHESAKVGTGTIQAKVDFANKKISGSSSADSNNFPGISFSNESISANGFSLNKDGVQVEAQFYGPQAAEMSGVYNNNGNYTAAFGARKVSP